MNHYCENCSHTGRMTDGVHMSLFDVEDTTDVPHVRDMIVAPVTTNDVDLFCRRYHYTETGGNMSWRWGLWHGPVLYGVIAYNLPTRTVCESVFGAEHFDKVWHMGRLSMADAAPPNSESRLIGGSLKRIEREHPDTWAVLTYAAQDVGHIGYVYQATNAIYTGSSSTEHYYLDGDGLRRSNYLGGHRVNGDRADSMGWTRQEGQPKHRYVYVLGSKTQRRQRLAMLKYQPQPYPKGPQP